MTASDPVTDFFNQQTSGSRPRTVTGAALKAGSSCGSCIPEIRSLIAALDKNLAA